LRDERKFAGLDELVGQMKLDIARADVILRDFSNVEQTS